MASADSRPWETFLQPSWHLLEGPGWWGAGPAAAALRWVLLGGRGAVRGCAVRFSILSEVTAYSP